MLRNLFLAGLIVSPIAFGGCTTCSHRAAFDALGSEVTPAVCGLQRNKVVVVLIGTESTLDLADMSRTAKRLNEAGFARVYRGGIVHAPWLKKEIERTHADDPETRFVIIGYDLGARMARELTCQLISNNIPVDSLVLLDPLAVNEVGNLTGTCDVTIVRSHGWSKGTFPDAIDRTVPGIGHIDLPTNEETITTITGILENAAGHVPMTSELSFPNRPAHLGSDWDFLLGPSPHSEPGAPPSKSIPEHTARVSVK